MQISFVIEANAFIREDEFLSGGCRKIKGNIASEQLFAAYSLTRSFACVGETPASYLSDCPDAENTNQVRPDGGAKVPVGD